MGLLIPEINREQERTLLYRKFNMSKELKDETLKALITGVDFLEKIKINLISNELRSKLDEVHAVFLELVKKWDEKDVNIKTEINCKKNVVTKSVSTLEARRVLGEKKSAPLNRISENFGEETKPNKKERSLFQQMRRKSKSDVNLYDEGTENKQEKKKLSAQDIVHIPTTEVKDNGTYLCLQGANSDFKMCSDTKKFRKVTKVKLKVNEKAIGGRMCCLQGTNLLLGRELNDQVAEYALNLKEYYRLINFKSLYFELSKREAIYSFRFENESECLDWYNTIDGIIESQGMYSYVSVPSDRRSNAQKISPIRCKINTTESAMSLGENNHHYDYPEIPIRKPRANTAFDVIDESNFTYSYTNSVTTTLRNSMVTETPEYVVGLPRTKNLLTGVKPKYGRERSMST